MADKIETTIFQAKAHWCKLLGKPQKTYDGKNTEWTVDLELDTPALKALQAFGIDRFYIKVGKPNKDKTPNALTGKPILRLDRKGVRKDGSAANPVKIHSPDGSPWNGDLIGNGSTVNVKIMKFEVALPGQPRRMKPYLMEMQVWEHIPYEGKEGGSSGFPTQNNRPATPKASDDWDFSTSTTPSADFDDEIPF